MGGQPDKKVTAQHLKDAAQDPALAPRAEELLALAEALDSADAGALDPWADLDLMGHFARPESIAEPAADDRGARFDSALDWILGALVFLPLLFTWAGLWKATSAYEALVGADPKAAGRPFLQLWQSGFQGHLDEVFRFGHVAVGGCLSLAMLFVLTAVHGYRRTLAERREEEARQRARQALARLVPVLTRAQLCLNDHRFASPQRFAAELNSAAGRLQRMHTKAIATQEQLTRAAELVGKAMEEADRRLARVEAYVRPLEDVATRFEETVRDSGTAIRTAVQDLDEPLSRAGDRLADAVDGQSSVLDKALDELRTTGDRMRDVLAQTTNRLETAVTGNSDSLRDVLTRTTDRLETAVTGNGDSLRGALSDTAQRVEDSLAVLAASQRGFTTGIEVVADLNGRLIGDLGAVAERTGEAAETSREALLGIEARSRALHEAADRFASVADALERAVHDAEEARADAEEARTRAETARTEAETARTEAEEARVRAEEALRRFEESRAEIESAR